MWTFCLRLEFCFRCLRDGTRFCSESSLGPLALPEATLKSLCLSFRPRRGLAPCVLVAQGLLSIVISAVESCCLGMRAGARSPACR